MTEKQERRSKRTVGEGGGRKTRPTRGVWGHAPPVKFEFARPEIESRAIWWHLKPSTHIVKLCNLLALEQRTRRSHTSVRSHCVSDDAIIQRRTHALIGKTPYVRIGIASSC